MAIPRPNYGRPEPMIDLDALIVVHERAEKAEQQLEAERRWRTRVDSVLNFTSGFLDAMLNTTGFEDYTQIEKLKRDVDKLLADQPQEGE